MEVIGFFTLPEAPEAAEALNELAARALKGGRDALPVLGPEGRIIVLSLDLLLAKPGERIPTLRPDAPRTPPPWR